jgi:predicted SnoaL-like aldol condensation-catalyzing enzyme
VYLQPNIIMHITPILIAFLAPITVFAAPTVHSRPHVMTIAERQARPIKPSPCVRNINATEAVTKTRSEAFAQAFIYKKDISEAFKYISKDYINHNPAAQNGSDSAWNILSPIWGSQNITPIRTAFTYPQSWLNYRTGSFGEVVDRYRWEGGCIVEHVSTKNYGCWNCIDTNQVVVGSGGEIPIDCDVATVVT